ncbi:MAG TPA: M1 family metallopeptidase [Rubrobacteraceae bacterium]|nr:M1 family metallopeptidase [Rubrobacteraceae bacterium]
MVLLGVIVGLILGSSLLLRGSEEADREAPTKVRPRPEKPPPSKFSYPGFYPARYDIDAIYKEKPRSTAGTQTVRYVNAEDEPMRSLHFRLWTNETVFTDLDGGTTVSSVTVDGEKSRSSLDGTDLEVFFPKPLPRNATAQVALRFETTIPEIAAPFGHDSGVSSMGVWYPILAVYDEDGWNLAPTTEFGEPYFSEVADYTVRLTLPKGLTPATTGVEKDHDEAGGEQTSTYEAESVRDFALAIGEEFERVSRRVGETTINVYHRPESAIRAGRALDLASSSLAFFSKTFGAYPYPEFDLVDAPLVAGTEYSTLTFANLENTQDYVFDTVVPRKVSHQWWYVQVGSDQFEEPWLDESLATYSEWLYTGDAASRFPDPVAPTTPLDTSVGGFPDSYTYQNVAYLRGAQLYRDLSYEIGEEKLLRGLRDYASRYRYRTVNADGLISTLSDSTGEDLSSFFGSHGIAPPKKN